MAIDTMIGEVREWGGQLYEIVSDSFTSDVKCDNTGELLNVVWCVWIWPENLSGAGTFQLSLEEIDVDRKLSPEEVMQWKLEQ